MLTVTEFAAAVAARWRAGTAPAPPDELCRLFDGWAEARAVVVPIVDADWRIADHFVRRFELRLRAPDALHVAVCRRLGARLLSFDDDQLAAAQALGIAPA